MPPQKSPQKPPGKKHASLSAEARRHIEEQAMAAADPLITAPFVLLGVVFEEESKQHYLRFSVGKTGAAISLDECAEISNRLDEVMEALPALANLSFTFEVSSPGIFRELTREREFVFFQGQPIRLENAPKGIPQAGVLTDFQAESNTLLLTTASSVQPIEIPLQSSVGKTIRVVLAPSLGKADPTVLTPVSESSSSL